MIVHERCMQPVPAPLSFHSEMMLSHPCLRSILTPTSSNAANSVADPEPVSAPVLEPPTNRPTRQRKYAREDRKSRPNQDDEYRISESVALPDIMNNIYNIPPARVMNTIARKVHSTCIARSVQIEKPCRDVFRRRPVQIAWLDRNWQLIKDIYLEILRDTDISSYAPVTRVCYMPTK